MNNIDILEEKENIKLEDKYKQTLKMAKEVMEDVCERNNGCEPSKSECLAYNMQYVKKYVETLIAENKELKESNEYLKSQIPVDKIFYYSYKDFIPKSKVEEEIEELSEELEIMKVDNMYGRYKEYGGKKKWEEMFQYKYGKHDGLQSLLGKE